MAARKPRTVAAPVAPPPVEAPVIHAPDPKNLIERATRYHEIPNGDGVLRADVGDYVVTVDGVTTVYPPERFAEAFPELVD